MSGVIKPIKYTGLMDIQVDKYGLYYQHIQHEIPRN